MKVSIVHPFKHHCYHSANGIKKNNKCELNVILGYYNKNDVIDRIIFKSPYKMKIKGYREENISNDVKVSKFIKSQFILSKLNNKFNNIYINNFEKFAIENIKNSKIIHVLQDYCNNVIRYSKDSNKIIVYEQIIAYDTTIKKYLEEEIIKWGFSNEYLERNYNIEKIEKSKYNIENANYIISPSKYVSDSIIKEFGKKIEKKIIQFPYGVDINKFKYLKKNYDKSELNVLCVSRVTLSKGTKYLIEAMKVLKNKKIKLTFIGMPVDEEDYRLVNELKNLENVNYISQVPHTEIHNYFEKSDIFILPSLIEGSALSIYEAMACGLPCIVTENCGSLVRDKKEGLLIQSQSIEDIVLKLEYCFNNKKLLEEMSIASRERVKLNNWDKYEENINNVYDKILNEKFNL